MESRIYLSSPHLGEKEREFVNEAFDTNWIAPLGPNVNGFEEELANYSGVPHCAALSSGTAAIHLALILAGVKKGDTVICQSFTFSGSANPIVYCGAEPVFVDSEKDTWNISPELLEEAIIDLESKGQKPKAIIYVHLYGMPAKIDEITQIAAKHGIALIEDAAEALGSTYKGVKCGNFGDISVYSFNGNKIITTSGGGALISKNQEFVEKTRFLATQARDKAPYYLHSEIGYNYRMSNICAGIGRGQLMVLDQRVSQRRANFDRYTEYFADKEGFELQKEVEGSFSNRWLSTLLIDDANSYGIDPDRIRLALEEKNIEARPLWNPMHNQPIFAKAQKYVNGVSEELFKIGLCLPSSSSMGEEEFDRIFSVLDSLFKK